MLNVWIRAGIQNLCEAAEKFDMRFLRQYDAFIIVQAVYNQRES